MPPKDQYASHPNYKEFLVRINKSRDRVNYRFQQFADGRVYIGRYSCYDGQPSKDYIQFWFDNTKIWTSCGIHKDYCEILDASILPIQEELYEEYDSTIDEYHNIDILIRKLKEPGE